MPERILRLGIDPGPAVRGAREFERATDRAGDSASRLNRRIEDSERQIVKQHRSLQLSSRVTFAAVAAGAAATVIALRHLSNLGAAAEETASKYRTVLGPSVEGVNDFLDEFAVKAGLSTREAQEIVSTTAAMAQGFGFSGDSAADLATDVTRLAGDLASFNNLPTAETARAIQSALAGERESLKRLGIVVLESEVQERALLNTRKTSVQQLTQAEKALASYQLIAERAGVAVGDLDRTQDSLANQQKRASAVQRDLADSLGTIVAKSVEASGAVGDYTAALVKLRDFVRDNQQQIQEGVGGFLIGAGQAIPFLGRLLQDYGANVIIAANATDDLADTTEFMAQATDKLRRGREEDARALQATVTALKEELALLDKATELRIAGRSEAQRLLTIQEQQRTIAADLNRSLEDRVTATERLLTAEGAINRFLAQRLRPGAAAPDRVQQGVRAQQGLGVDLDASIRATIEGFGQLVPLMNVLGETNADVRDKILARLAAEERLRKHMERLEVVDAAVRGVASLVSALSLIPDNAARAVRGISDILSGLQDIQAGGLGSARGVGGALSVVGGFAGFVGGILGDRDRQEEARRKAIEEANKALADFAESLRDVTSLERDRERARDLARGAAFAQFPEAAPGGRFSAGGRRIETLGFDFIDEAVRAGQEWEQVSDGLFGPGGSLNPDLIKELGEPLRQYYLAQRRIEEQRQKDIASLGDEFRVRALVAQGKEDEAAALRLQIEREKDVAQARALEDDELVKFIESVHAFEDAAAEAAKAAEAAAEAERKLAEARASRDQGQIRLFEAQGNTGAADALRRRIEQQGILDHALDVGGLALVEFWQEVFQVEAAAREAARAADELARALERAQRTMDLTLDLALRDARLRGDTEGELRIIYQQQRTEAERLFAAGEINQRLFNEWVRIIDGELNRALEDAARAAREAAEAERFRQMVDTENLRVRLLLAQGRDVEAQQLRNQIELLQALEDERSAEYIALLKQVQAQEAANKAQAEAKRQTEETQRAFENLSRALNRPSGVRLSLLRYQASRLAGPVDLPSFGGAASGASGATFGVTSPNFSQPITQAQNVDQKTVINGDVVLNLQAGPNGLLDIDGIRRQLQTIKRAGGGNRLGDLNV